MIIMDMPELITAYYTITPDVHPIAGPKHSAHPLRDRLAAAAKAGFSGIGFTPAELAEIVKVHSLAEIRSILDDFGMTNCEVEGMLPWYARHDQPEHYASVSAPMFQAVEELPLRHMKVAGPLNIDMLPPEFHGAANYPSYSVSQLTDTYGKLCEELAQRAPALAVFEFMTVGTVPFDDVVQIVAGAGAPNGGLLLDSWHICKTRIDLNKIAELPAHLIRYVELSDGELENGRTILDDTVNNRRMCGEGQFDLTGVISAVRKAGYDGPYGVEIMSETLRRMSLEENAACCAQTMLPYLGSQVGW